MKTNKIAQNTFLIVATVLFAVSIGYHADLGSLSEGMDEDNYYLHYNIKNTGTFTLDDGRITIWVPELELYTHSNNFNLKKNNINSGFVFPLEDYYGNIEPGEYLTRIKYTNDRTSNAKWVWLWLE